jgi:hypothetical protein
MRRALFAIAIAAVMLVAGTPSQSAPIAPLPESIVQDTGGMTQVWWYRYHYRWHRHYWHRRYWHYRHWHRCWHCR